MLCEHRKPTKVPLGWSRIAAGIAARSRRSAQRLSRMRMMKANMRRSSNQKFVVWKFR